MAENAKPKLKVADLESYARLRISLDSFRDEVLYRYGQCASGGERNAISDRVKAELLKAIKEVRTLKTAAPIKVSVGACPPGFHACPTGCCRNGVGDL